VIRGIIQSVVEGVIKRFTASGRVNETITSREYFQHYGFTSRPLAGAEGIIITESNVFIMVASDDRRYRVVIEDGEVALYDDLGQKVHLTRTGIEVESPTKIEATAPEVVVTAGTNCQINSPSINLSGDRSGLRRLIDERFKALFDAHVHPVATHGNSGVPTVAVDLASQATDIVRGA